MLKHSQTHFRKLSGVHSALKKHKLGKECRGNRRERRNEKRKVNIENDGRGTDGRRMMMRRIGREKEKWRERSKF